METTKVLINGIVRNKAADDYADGDCQEIMNMRFRDGAWRIRKGAKKLYNAPANAYDVIELHTVDISTRHIGYSSETGNLCDMNMQTGAETVIKTYESGKPVKITFLKRFMLVQYSGGMDRFIYKSGTYTLTNIVAPPSNLYLQSGANATTTTDRVMLGDALLGKYREVLNQVSNASGSLWGGIFYRLAYKLFDGSYVLATLPVYHKCASLEGEIKYTQVAGNNNDGWTIKFYTAIVNAKINRAFYNNLVGLKDIISSVCIFVCKNESALLIDETTLSDDIMKSVNWTSRSLSAFFPFNEKFKKMADSTGWHLAHEIPFLEAGNVYMGSDVVLNFKGFYTNYMAGMTLPADSFSYHDFFGENSMVYNDRLMLSGVSVSLGNYVNTSFGELTGYTSAFTEFHTGNVYNPSQSGDSIHAIVFITSSLGEYSKIIDVGGPLFTRNGSSYVIFNNALIGYPDARATAMKILVKSNDVYYEIASVNLVASKNDNYSFYHSPNFSATNINNTDRNYAMIIFPAVLDTVINIAAYDNAIIYDANRVQASAFRNPYSFPAKNSYQVGSGEIVGFGTNAEPVSEGQFGQYPLFVFTSKGILAMEQGQGDVLFASIVPVSEHVAVSKTKIVNVSAGVLFTTARGVYIISGKNITEISEKIEGNILTYFNANNNFKYLVSTPSLSVLNEYISTINAKTFIEGNGSTILPAKIGFDKVNNEIVFSNSTQGDANEYLFPYSYIYSLETNTWHKVSKTYTMFISNYPALFAICDEGIVNISEDNDSNVSSVLIVSQPMQFKMPGMYKKVERFILRANLRIQEACYFSFVLFASDDLKKWVQVAGSQRNGEVQNILVTRSPGSARYYIVVLSGSVFDNSTISAVDVSVTARLNAKLRR